MTAILGKGITLIQICVPNCGSSFETFTMYSAFKKNDCKMMYRWHLPEFNGQTPKDQLILVSVLSSITTFPQGQTPFQGTRSLGLLVSKSAKEWTPPCNSKLLTSGELQSPNNSWCLWWASLLTKLKSARSYPANQLVRDPNLPSVTTLSCFGKH